MLESDLGISVIDASLTTAWLLPDESNSRVNALIARVEIEGGIIPLHWHFEVRNALLMAERRGRIAAGTIGMHLSRLNRLSLDTDQSPNLDAALDLARRHHLSFYDALYLELALRRDIPLATLDSALDRAASAEGLPALP